MIRRWSLIALLALLVPSSAVRAEEPELTFEQAFMIAQRQVPDGTLIRGRVEGSSVFGFYFWQRPHVVEVEIMKSGSLKKRVRSDSEDEVVSQDILDLMNKLTRGKTKLPDGRILEIAGKKNKDNPLKDLKYLIQDGRLQVQVGDVLIDPETGRTNPVTPAPRNDK